MLDATEHDAFEGVEEGDLESVTIDIQQQSPEAKRWLEVLGESQSHHLSEAEFAAGIVLIGSIYCPCFIITPTERSLALATCSRKYMFDC